MRSVVIALVVIALSVSWLATRYADDTRQNPAVTERNVTPVTMPQESGLPVEDQEAFQATIHGEAITNTIESSALSDPMLQTSEIEFAPEMRDKFVDYLSVSGLAPVDAERIADSALAGVGECIEQAFGNRDDEPASNQAATCMFNVLADYGLNATPVTEIDLATLSLP